MVNYNDSSIYKIWSPLGDDIYIGSTTRKLCVRMAQHRCCFRTMKGSKKTSFRILY
jgi:hypothetical protein